MRKFGCLFAAVVALALTAGAAQAAFIEYTVPYGPNAVPDAGTNIAVQQFDETTFGTLLKVTLTLDATAQAGSLTWDNESGVVTDVTLGIGGEITAAAPSALTLVAVPLQTGTGLNIAADDDGSPPDYAGADSYTLTGGVGTDSDQKEITDALLFAPYKGIGTFNVAVSSILKTSIVTTGGIGLTQPTAGTTSGLVTVRYDYVPEPATMA
ncbi:MAG TPA: choice-of-anchor E domain-containing protein, partial [Phycisphaerae bacterium]|nr:choice-of-anchor E domain-containing protein [Phycisphaerae bacterium]